MSGWVKLHRSIQDHWIWDSPEYLRAWLDMCMMANHKGRKEIINNSVHLIPRGSFDAPFRFLAKRWKWSKGRVARFIDALKTDTMIDTANGTGRTVVTICNYDTYQDRGLENGTANGTATGTATGHSRVHIQEGKELKELKELKKPPFIPPGDPDILKSLLGTGFVQKDYKKKYSSIESKYHKCSTGVFRAYCSKCGKVHFANDKYQLRKGSECCRVEFQPDPFKSVQPTSNVMRDDGLNNA
ncbi:MAG: hypothetical protein CMB80_03225 [Flammeovirgaceae bacterium]|nr:hypothetical protein [Flammeovirgaceae bacterium]